LRRSPGFFCIRLTIRADCLRRLDPEDEDDRLRERDSISGIGQSWLRRLTDERKAVVAEAIAYWSFSAHDFSDDELLYAALLMLEHTLQMPELAPWHASTGTNVRLASREANLIQTTWWCISTPAARRTTTSCTTTTFAMSSTYYKPCSIFWCSSEPFRHTHSTRGTAHPRNAYSHPYWSPLTL
jgi:hypothetical protein